MNRTSIDWADMTWNPVTGCRHGCRYCYARETTARFGGHDAGAPAFTAGGLNMLDEPMQIRRNDGRMVKAPFPFFFEPTFHRYRLEEPLHANMPCNIFVCSMSDLFGKWVPTGWIVQVLDACLAAPQHNYLFLTKNPGRYMELDKLALLPRKGNFWYGSTTTKAGDPFFWSDKHNTFVSAEPLHGPLHAGGVLETKWVIVGAETGSRKDKQRTLREWVLNLADECREQGVPIFMKENLVTEGVLTRGEIIQKRPAEMTFY